MRISDFDYDLPQSLIAQSPIEHREDSRMLVVDRAEQNFSDRKFVEISSFLKKGDLLVINNTKVFPARLIGETETGAKVEIFLVREGKAGLWTTLGRPAKRLKVGKKLRFGPRLAGEVQEKHPDGKIDLSFQYEGNFYEILDSIGRTPLPPYIKRDPSGSDQDRERYQTVFAKKRGAIAAPTAGLHFTAEVLAGVREAGADIAEITLHVGYGTFEPVRVGDLSQHTVSPELYEITEETAGKLNTAKAEGRRIVAVGTTTTRALESNLSSCSSFAAGSFSATLTITPGYRFKAVGALLTNFHLPQSSLLVLVSTFGGHDLIMRAYLHAVESRYRFYSYGDCMLII
jgi:S-adenosylmethionine:tRNA ribosyltransferase-isomerase